MMMPSALLPDPRLFVGEIARKSPGSANSAQAEENTSFSGAGNRLEIGWKQACHFAKFATRHGGIRAPGPLA